MKLSSIVVLCGLSACTPQTGEQSSALDWRTVPVSDLGWSPPPGPTMFHTNEPSDPHATGYIFDSDNDLAHLGKEIDYFTVRNRGVNYFNIRLIDIPATLEANPQVRLHPALGVNLILGEPDIAGVVIEQDNHRVKIDLYGAGTYLFEAARAQMPAPVADGGRTPLVAAGAALGAGAMVTVVAGGQIVVTLEATAGTGASPGVIATVTPQPMYLARPFVLCTPSSASAQGLYVDDAASTSSSWVLGTTATLAPGTVLRATCHITIASL